PAAFARNGVSRTRMHSEGSGKSDATKVTWKAFEVRRRQKAEGIAQVILRMRRPWIVRRGRCRLGHGLLRRGFVNAPGPGRLETVSRDQRLDIALQQLPEPGEVVRTKKTSVDLPDIPPLD